MDLNADVGEGCGDDDALLGLVSSASVACGFHAGGPATMLLTAQAARLRGVTVGAHPSYPDRGGFGRVDMDLPAEELAAVVAYQVGAMTAAAALAGTEVRFVKPHGALYNRAARDAAVAGAVVEAVGAAGGAQMALLGPAGSELVRRAQAAGLRTFAEGFADRAYAPDGSLTPRSEPASVLEDPASVARQALGLVLDGRVATASGATIELHVDSLCLHGDNPRALDVARSLRAALEEAGVAVRPFIS
ncbi:MAG: LamB/YcsF family protein [Acidimicrobiales bacterium]|nr:LamB/YcsF family protein [Acidimicrobiales bacterium]